MPKNTKKERAETRSNWFCTTSNIPEQMELLKESCKCFKRWFWIEHQPDLEDSKVHIHVMVMYGGSCFIRTAASLLGVPEHMVQFVEHGHRSYGQYMVHKNSPDKIKYSSDDVHTNYPGIYKSMLCDSANDDINSLYHDLQNFKRGKISLNDFIELHYLEFQTMPFYQKIKTFEYLEKSQSALT